MSSEPSAAGQPIRAGHTIGLIDDDVLTRDALQILLESRGYVVLTFASADAYFAARDSREVGCVIADLPSPERGGIELQAELAKRGLWLPLIFLTGLASVPLGVRAMKYGAIDFLTKPCAPARLLATVAAAMTISSDVRDRLSQVAVARHQFSSLSTREQEILQLNARGLTNKEIGARLDISHRTVETYKSRIMVKTGISNAVGLAGLQWTVDPPPDPGWLLRYFPQSPDT